MNTKIFFGVTLIVISIIVLLLFIGIFVLKKYIDSLSWKNFFKQNWIRITVMVSLIILFFIIGIVLLVLQRFDKKTSDEYLYEFYFGKYKDDVSKDIPPEEFKEFNNLDRIRDITENYIIYKITQLKDWLNSEFIKSKFKYTTDLGYKTFLTKVINHYSYYNFFIPEYEKDELTPNPRKKTFKNLVKEINSSFLLPIFSKQYSGQ